MDYVGRIYRPPSEADSLLVQITIGCSHNRCTYCQMYRDKSFRIKPLATIEADLREAAQLGPRFRRVFLCDGDALITPTKRLLAVLRLVAKHTPWVERVGVYGDTRSVLRKSVAELRELRDAGLGIVYHGIESGDDEVMRQIDKGATAAGCVATAERLREAGLLHSVMVLLGVGGVALSTQHARNTAATLTRMDPPYVGALTTTVTRGTPLWDAVQRGTFELPGKFDLLEELRVIVADSAFTRCRFSANHASNYLPIRADLPQDRDALVALLDRVIEARDESALVPEWRRAL